MYTDHYIQIINIIIYAHINMFVNISHEVCFIAAPYSALLN